MGFTWGSRYLRETKMAEDGESLLDHAFVKVCDIFGFEKLNKHQEEAIRQVVELKVDVYVNLLTGYGNNIIKRNSKTRMHVLLSFF